MRNKKVGGAGKIIPSDVCTATKTAQKQTKNEKANKK